MARRPRRYSHKRYPYRQHRSFKKSVTAFGRRQLAALLGAVGLVGALAIGTFIGLPTSIGVPLMFVAFLGGYLVAYKVQWRRWLWNRKIRTLKLGPTLGIVAVLTTTAITGLYFYHRANDSSVQELSGKDTFRCDNVRVIDGDTLDCGDIRVRLQGIDAPELPGHCRPGRQCTPGDPFASTANLESLTSGRSLTCRQTDIDHYGRSVARCSTEQVDLSCAQIESGHAVRRYGWIWCGL